MHANSRFHSGMTPVREEPEEVITLKQEQIEVKEYVGGLVRSFERRAA